MKNSHQLRRFSKVYTTFNTWKHSASIFYAKWQINSSFILLSIGLDICGLLFTYHSSKHTSHTLKHNHLDVKYLNSCSSIYSLSISSGFEAHAIPLFNLGPNEDEAKPSFKCRLITRRGRKKCRIFGHNFNLNSNSQLTWMKGKILQMFYQIVYKTQ